MKILSAFLSATLGILIVSSASAQTPSALWWDPNLSLGASLGGSGNWDTNATDNVTNWFDSANDDLWTNGNYDAWFTGPAGTVTIAAGQDIYAADLIFTNVTGSGYYITNSTGAEILNVANTIDTETNDDTIAAPIGNSGTLTKTGNGTLDLPLDNSANLTGNVLVNEGAIQIENDNSLGNTLAASVTVTNGGAVNLDGTAGNLLGGVNCNLILSGSGVTNSGAIRNLSGFTHLIGKVTFAGNVTLDSDLNQLNLDGYQGGPITNAYGSNYNVSITGKGAVLIDSTVFNIGTGSIFVETNATFYMYVPSADVVKYTNIYVGPGATFEALNDISFGTIPATLLQTNVILDGGTVAMASGITSSSTRGITVTPNGGVIFNFAGTWTLPYVYGTNCPVLFTNANGTGEKFGNAATLNLGSAPLVIGGGNFTLEPTSANPTYSNLVLNGDTFTFNYDNGGSTPVDLGAVPSTPGLSNIWLNNAGFHIGHSTAIQNNRGIYVAPGGATLDEVTGTGNATVPTPISGPGNVTFTSGGAGASVLLESNNTYAATIITVGAVNVGGGTANGTLGTGNTTDNAILTFNRTTAYTYAGAISGTGVVNDSGSGTITLTGKSTYTGVTTLSKGILLMNNTNASAITVASGGTLGGTGPFGGTVGVSSGGTLTLGSGTLSTSNNLTLSGNVNALLNKSLPQTSGTAIVSGNLTGSGTVNIAVTNQGPALVAGDTFALFSKAISGGTVNITGGGTGVTWLNNGDGTFTVQAVVPAKPLIKQTLIQNGNVIISGINGTAGDTNYLYATTNILLPLNQWTFVSSNIFTGSAFSITNPVVPGIPQEFYMLQVPYVVIP